MLKGVCAYGQGKLKGEVMIINDPIKDYFESGKIMVTPKTTVDSISLMKKALAVVTNHGGRTSHAMIVCQDNNIWCIIGTINATQKLKDGDIIELNFETKEIKLLEK